MYLVSVLEQELMNIRKWRSLTARCTSGFGRVKQLMASFSAREAVNSGSFSSMSKGTNKVFTAPVKTMTEVSWISPKGFQMSVIDAHRTIPPWWRTGAPLFLEKNNQLEFTSWLAYSFLLRGNGIVSLVSESFTGMHASVWSEQIQIV